MKAKHGTFLATAAAFLLIFSPARTVRGDWINGEYDGFGPAFNDDGSEYNSTDPVKSPFETLSDTRTPEKARRGGDREGKYDGKKSKRKKKSRQKKSESGKDKPQSASTEQGGAGTLSQSSPSEQITGGFGNTDQAEQPGNNDEEDKIAGKRREKRKKRKPNPAPRTAQGRDDIRRYLSGNRLWKGGLNPEIYKRAIAQGEGGEDEGSWSRPNGHIGHTGGTGKYQFIGSTRKWIAKELGIPNPDLKTFKSSPALQEKFMEFYTRDQYKQAAQRYGTGSLENIVRSMAAQHYRGKTNWRNDGGGYVPGYPQTQNYDSIRKYSGKVYSRYKRIAKQRS